MNPGSINVWFNIMVAVGINEKIVLGTRILKIDRFNVSSKLLVDYVFMGAKIQVTKENFITESSRHERCGKVK